MFYFASDLHFGVHPKGDAAVHRLADTLSRQANAKDTLLLGGDLAVNDKTVRACLKLFQGFPGKRIAILGNHDVWVERGDHSLERYARLQTIIDQEGFHPLEERSAIVDGWGLVGALGWYDYSFRDEEINAPKECYKQKRSPTSGQIIWNDARYVNWKMDDASATEWQITRLQSRLREVESAERIIALLHHVPHKSLLIHPRWLVPKQWRFANAFLGSNRFSEILEANQRVKLVVNGHIHLARSTRRHSIDYHSIGGDYDKKQLLAFDGKRMQRTTIS